MEDGGKRRQRLRLIRWAVPLLTARPGQIPESHEGVCVCVACEASRRLTDSDWCAVDFFAFVRDQADNLAPLGDSDGKAVLMLRLESLDAACRICEVPRRDRADLVEVTRILFDAAHRRSPMLVRDASSCAPSDLSAIPAPGDA